MKTLVAGLTLIAGMLFLTSATTDSNPKTGPNCVISSADFDEVKNRLEISAIIDKDVEEGYYGLMRIYEDGRTENIAYRKILVNQPFASYLFSDLRIPCENCEYVLVRISSATRKFEVIQKWSFAAISREIKSKGDLMVNN